MDYLFVCPSCRSVHNDPADAAFVLAALCLDCEIEARYFDDMTCVELTARTAA
jgi:hypothetical protein